MRATAFGLLALGFGLGCQTYDFEPVSPLAIAQTTKPVCIAARPPKPNLFLVVDKSGSMRLEVSPGVSRMDAMKNAMGNFLTAAGNTAHLGMLPFPSNDTCGAGDLPNVATIGVPLDLGDDDDARLQQSALVVKAKIDQLQPNGGTPTGETMRQLGGYTPLLAMGRTNFAVLLTDGLPNCNPALDADTCTCTAAQRPCSSAGNNLCLDDSGASADIALLNQKGVRTIVIGFGADVANPLGASTLASMASAGGFNRPCTQASDCNAGDSCNPGGVDPCGRPASTCGQSYFSAANAAELGRVLDAIRDSVTCPACNQPLNAPPSDPDLITVLIDQQPVGAGPDTWRYTRTGTGVPAIEFLGSTCARLMTSTPADPLCIEIRTVEKL